MSGEQVECNWSLKEVFLAGLFIGIFVFLSSFVIFPVLELKPALYCLLLLNGTFVVLLVLFIVKRKHRMPLAALGFRPGRYPVSLSVSLAAVVAFLLETAVYASPFAQPSPLLQSVWQNWEESRTMLLIALLIQASGFSSVFIAPAAEEIFFRGFMLPCFNAKWGWPKGILLQALLFSLVHTEYLSGDAIYYLSFRFVLGILLGALYVKTGSLYPCIAAHTAYNFSSVFNTAFFWKFM